MRIGLLALLHESNTFSRQPTSITSFQENLLLEGEPIRAALADTHHEVGGFFTGLKESGVDAVPLFAARALPSATIEADAFRELVRRLLGTVDRAGHLDGLLVAPHGATVSEQWPDADGYWLEELRRLTGDRIPIIGTLDPHANLSHAMVRNCNALIAYRTNPHLDQRERGIEAARLIVQTVRGQVRPRMAALFPPLAISIERQCTDEPPLRPLYELAAEQRGQPGVISNSVLLGFPYADVQEMGSSVVVVTNDNQDLAEASARSLATQMWNDRARYRGDFTAIPRALDGILNETGPVCLLDMGDNVGGGSSADGTALVAALHDRQIGPAFVCLYDPESVITCDQASAGQPLTLSVGGKTDSLHGPPISLTVTVQSMHDGRFHEPQPRHGGMRDFNQGRTAICRTMHGLTLMLTSRRMVPFSLQQLTSCQLDPQQFRVIVAKGVNAPIAAYRAVCRRFIRVNTPGSTSADMRQLAYENRRHPMVPFETETTWDPAMAPTQAGHI